MNISIDSASVSPLDKPVEATVNVPGSKSYTLRALLIAAICDKPVDIRQPLMSEDTAAMVNCLTQLGVDISQEKDLIRVTGSAADIQDKHSELDVDISGTTLRFMTAFCCVIPGIQTISGKEGLNKRPAKDLVEALQRLGAKIEYMGKQGYPPLKITSNTLSGSKTSLSGTVSSQYLSALLLISPLLQNGLDIEVVGGQVSRPYIDMTTDIMSYFGVTVSNNDYKSYKISRQAYQPKDYAVESDYSSAAYFFAIAALTGSKITARNMNPGSKQSDRLFLEALKSMGAEISMGKNSITVKGNGVKPIEIDANGWPDQAMTMAVLCAYANGKSTIKGVKSLRVKETERVKAVENELAKMGIKTVSTEDTLTIYGGQPGPARIETYGDHRIAMALAVAATKTPGVQVMHPEVVGKTFPGFWDELAKITPVNREKFDVSNVVLIGMRGSGKTTVGEILAKKLGKDFVDMDQHLETKYGQKVRDIVLENGWGHFRKIESEACEEISRKKDQVISSGGGIVLDQKNIEFFKPNSALILLRTDPGILSNRIRTDKNRPELSTQPTLLGELDEVWEERRYKYFKNADFIIDTSHDNPDAIAGHVMTKLAAPTPKICMVIGDPVEHSLSPLIHSLGYKKLGLEQQFIYSVKRVKTDEIRDFISQVVSENIRGVSLTMPHKELIIESLDKVDPIAKKIGAVNTVVNDNGILTGYNTDWIGALKPLEKLTGLNGKKVAIIGAGGTAKAFTYALTKAGSEVTIYNRTVSKAKDLADKFSCKYSDLVNSAEINKADIICNTTSVGMNENKSPIDTSLIKAGQIVFDAVYSPIETTLLKAAKAKGATTISGIELLLYQAAAQFKLFTGKEAPVDQIRMDLMEKINAR